MNDKELNIDGIPSASYALKQSKINENIHKAQDELKKIEKEHENKLRQKKIDDDWIDDAILSGKKIIQHIIEHSDRFGIGVKNKCNGYFAKFSGIGLAFHEYSFIDPISDDAISIVHKYFTDLGYGCEIRKAKPGITYYDRGTRGTMHIWIPTEDEKTQEREDHEYLGGISW